MGTMGTLFRDLLFFQGYVGDPALLEALAREAGETPEGVPHAPATAAPAAPGGLVACC